MRKIFFLSLILIAFLYQSALSNEGEVWIDGVQQSSSSSSEWTDASGILHPADSSGDQTVVVGGTTTANSDIILNKDGQLIVNSTGQSGNAIEVRGGTPEAPQIADNEDTIAIYGDSRAYFKARDVTNNIEILFGTSTSGVGFIGSMTNHDFQIRGSNNTATIHVEAGQVGIGVAADNPVNVLDVDGAMVIGGSYAENQTAPSNGLLVEGMVGIGTVSTNSALNVGGSIEITGNGNTCTITVDADGTCDTGTALVVDNSIAICAVCL